MQLYATMALCKVEAVGCEGVGVSVSGCVDITHLKFPIMNSMQCFVNPSCTNKQTNKIKTNKQHLQDFIR